CHFQMVGNVTLARATTSCFVSRRTTGGGVSVSAALFLASVTCLATVFLPGGASGVFRLGFFTSVILKKRMAERMRKNAKARSAHGDALGADPFLLSQITAGFSVGPVLALQDRDVT